MFLASDLGGYAAVASIWILKALSYVVRADRVVRPYRRAKVPRPRRDETSYFNGAFFILAQLLGNWGGVSFTLRMITTRWVTSVPGMA